MTTPTPPPTPAPTPADVSKIDVDLAAAAKDFGIYGAPLLTFVIVLLNAIPSASVTPAVQAVISAAITLATSLLAIAKSRQAAVAKAAVAVQVTKQ